MNFRHYNPKTDKDPVFRILNEIGWASDKNKSRYLNILLPAANTLVSDINGEAEVMANSSLGTMQYLNEKLDLCAITGVAASLIARKQGYAGRLAATRLALDAAKGSEIAALSIFDQGYYNKLGFCNGNYENIVAFSPSSLQVNRRVKPPIRLTNEDFSAVHLSRMNRMQSHGAITLPEYTTVTEMGKPTEHLGLGYLNASGEITHHIWLQGKGKENGPIRLNWLSYQNLDQLMDLLALIKSFEEQYHLVSMIEPSFIHLQDFIKRPYLFRAITNNSKYQNSAKNTAFWQIRILNLLRCLEKTHLNCADFSFNLELSDPITKYIPSNCEWKGIGGNYIVTLGNQSSAKDGSKAGLPILKASVNAFSRLWFGIMPATSLVYSDGLVAPAELLHKLDGAFLLPKAHVDWEF